MNSDHAMTCFIDLPAGRRVEIGMTVVEEPLFPTPGEPDQERVPMVHEWADICAALATMNISSIKLRTP